MGSVGGLKRELKSRPMRCEGADEPVVVRKPWPVKAGNGLEDKTMATQRLVVAGGLPPKA